MLSFRSHGYGRGQGRRREGQDEATRTNSKSGFRPPVKREGQLGDTVTSGCWFSGRLLRTDSRHRRQADGATGEGRRPRAAAQCHRPACKLKDLVTQYRVTLADLTASQDPEVVILVALLECKRLYICRDTYTFLIRFKRINNI